MLMNKPEYIWIACAVEAFVANICNETNTFAECFDHDMMCPTQPLSLECMNQISISWVEYFINITVATKQCQLPASRMDFAVIWNVRVAEA